MYKILLVDDEHLEREALRKIISKNLDYAQVIGETGLGRKAIELSEELNPHLIFMDIKMPSMDGIEAANIIKEKNLDKVIILLTAYDDFEFAQRAIKANVDDYILKPVREKKILDIVEEHYKKRNKKLVELPIEDSYADNVISKDLLKAMEYIRDNFHNGITLNDVAKHVNLNTYYLSKLFKKEIGINFIDYITSYRMKKARELLRNTDIAIINISIELGYNEPNYFSQVFKKKFGITPSQYREQEKKERIKKLKSNPFFKNTPRINGRWYI